MRHMSLFLNGAILLSIAFLSLNACQQGSDSRQSIVAADQQDVSIKSEPVSSSPVGLG